MQNMSLLYQGDDDADDADDADHADGADDAADGDDDADDGEHFQTSQEGLMRYQKLGLWDKTGQK